MTPFFNNVFPPEVVTLVSHAPHDFSLPDAQNDLTEEQKRFLSQKLGFIFSVAASIRQVHGNKVIFISKSAAQMAPGVLEGADGILTDAVNMPIVIRTADCVPIFLYDREKGRIGLLHAGWKGTQKKILQEGLRLIGARCENIKVAFGPAIRECCYQIGSDVLEHFSNDAIERKGKSYLDLVAVNRAQAIVWGVPSENITDCGICTCCNTNYFSYRRQGERAGRNISLMMLKNG